MLVGGAPITAVADDDDDDDGSEFTVDAEGRKFRRVRNTDGTWRLVLVGARGVEGGGSDDVVEGSGMTVSRPGGSKGRHMVASRRMAAEGGTWQQRNTDSEGDGDSTGPGKRVVAKMPLTGNRGAVVSPVFVCQGVSQSLT